MKTIVVASRGGGAGRTTLTAHLAIASERAGVGTVAILDTDPQGSLAQWWNARAATTPRFARLGKGGLAPAIAAMRHAGVDLLLIDTPRTITDAINATVDLSDLVLIPARPSPIDLGAVRGTIELVLRAGKPSVLLLNSVKPRTRLTQEAISVLQLLGDLCPTLVYDRTDYAGAMTSGLVAPELDPTGRASDEMAAVWDHLAGRLGRHAAPKVRRHNRQLLTGIFEDKGRAEPTPNTAGLTGALRTVGLELDANVLRGRESVARKSLTASLTLQHHDALRIVAVRKGLTITNIVEALVVDYLTKLGEKDGATSQ